MIALGTSDLYKVYLGDQRVYSVMYQGVDLLADLFEDVAWQVMSPSTYYSSDMLNVGYGNSVYSFGGLYDEVYSAETRAYDTLTDTYTSYTDGDVRMLGCGDCIGDYVYVFGGRSALDVSTSVASRYDIINDSWTSIASMSSARGAGAALAYQDKIYIFGGVGTGSAASYSSIYINTCLIYDPVTNTYSNYVSLPVDRAYTSVARIDKKIYLISGYYVGSGYSACYALDIDTQTWSTITSLPVAVYKNASTVYHDKIFSIGGNRTGIVTSGVCYYYDPQTGTWSGMLSLNSNRTVSTAPLVNNSIYAVRGWSSSDGYRNSLEKFTF